MDATTCAYGGIILLSDKLEPGLTGQVRGILPLQVEMYLGRYIQ